jgi:glycosyltransferase involved in cell wall biosynthesis
MSPGPLVSVIIACFKQDRFVAETRSVCRQTHPHFEIIVLDDGIRSVKQLGLCDTLFPLVIQRSRSRPAHENRQGIGYATRRFP